MRARLAASEQPRRIFDAVLDAARQAGALSQRRVLDSVPIYDAVATQDTTTMLHRAIRAVLAAASDAAVEAPAALSGDYASGAKAHCDWDDPRARQELVDRLGADAAAVLAALEGRELDGALSEAAELLAAVAGQDLCQDRGGRFMIARRVAKDRVLSTVDPDARHGHKSTARRFDGYKGHTAVDPDSELITATAVTPANTADAQPAPELINDLLNTADTADTDCPQCAGRMIYAEKTRMGKYRNAPHPDSALSFGPPYAAGYCCRGSVILSGDDLGKWQPIPWGTRAHPKLCNAGRSRIENTYNLAKEDGAISKKACRAPGTAPRNMAFLAMAVVTSVQFMEGESNTVPQPYDNMPQAALSLFCVTPAFTNGSDSTHPISHEEAAEGTAPSRAPP